LIPLKDNVPTRKFPFINYGLILINVAVFVYQITLQHADLVSMVQQFAFIPADFTTGLMNAPFSLSTYYPVITAMFIHGSLGHILFNMLYLYIFGDNVEDRMGHWKYLVFYLLTGFLAAMAQYVIGIYGETPMVGASGAISGILAAYLFIYPHSRVLTITPFILVFTLIPVPAFFYILLWFFLQILNAVSSLFQEVGNVAWMAHIGGFVGGAVLYRFFIKKEKKKYAEYM
jgi:membrane associated rhomboid family serine protease